MTPLLAAAIARREADRAALLSKPRAIPPDAPMPRLQQRPRGPRGPRPLTASQAEIAAALHALGVPPDGIAIAVERTTAAVLHHFSKSRGSR